MVFIQKKVGVVVFIQKKVGVVVFIQKKVGVVVFFFLKKKKSGCGVFFFF